MVAYCVILDRSIAPRYNPAMVKENRVPIAVRLPRETLKRLDELADSWGTNRTGMLVRLVADAKPGPVAPERKGNDENP